MDSVDEAYRRLLKAYGERPLEPHRAPMHELISTIASTGR
jgi:hypothetical protein